MVAAKKPKKPTPPKKKKPLTVAKVRKAIKKVKPEKANLNWAIDNANAQKWTKKGLQELAEKIAEASEDACSIVEIAVKCGVAYQYLVALGRRYSTVCKALDLASNKIAALAWTNGFNSKGFPNILQMALKRHDVPQVEIEQDQETKVFDKKEGIKAKHGAKSEGPTLIIQEKIIYKDIPQKPERKKLK